jgi:hypothetical protein
MNVELEGIWNEAVVIEFDLLLSVGYVTTLLVSRLYSFGGKINEGIRKDLEGSGHGLT